MKKNPARRHPHENHHHYNRPRGGRFADRPRSRDRDSGTPAVAGDLSLQTNITDSGCAAAWFMTDQGDSVHLALDDQGQTKSRIDYQTNTVVSALGLSENPAFGGAVYHDAYCL